MINIINYLTVIVNQGFEKIRKSKISLVSSEREMRKILKKLNLDENNLFCSKTKKKIENLSEIEGIYRKDGRVYVFSESNHLGESI